MFVEAAAAAAVCWNKQTILDNMYYLLPLSFVEEVPLGDIHCRFQQQRQHHQPGSDQAFGVHPVSESRGGPLSMTDGRTKEEDGQKFILTNNGY